MDNPLTLSEIRIYRYRIPCVKPLNLRGITLSERQGLIVELIDDRGYRGLGEVTPLPGFSREHLNQALQQLRRCCHRVLAIALDRHWARWQGEYDVFYRSLLGPQDRSNGICPSVRMGLEFAICELLSRRQGLSLATVFNPTASEIPVLCPLLMGSNQDIIQKAVQLKARTEFSQVKLKVGRQAPEDDARLLQTLLRVLGESTFFRLDANCQWSYEDAMRFANLAPRERILYVEEPTGSLEVSRRFCKMTGIGLALDETLQDPDFVLERFEELAALVVKPTLCGGLERTLMLVRQAQNWRLPVIISSSYESSLGIGQLAELAMAATPGELAGLDTLDALVCDLVRPAESLNPQKPRPLLTLEQLELVWRHSQNR